MKYKNDKSYKNSFYLAVILHIILAILLGIKIATHEKQSTALNETQIVQAFSVNNVANKPTEITTPKKPEPTPKELPTPPQPEVPTIEQPKEEKKPEPQESKKANNDLEKALHEKMLQDQQAELQAISKELEKKKKQQEKKKQEQQKKEKQLLHDALANELAKEDSKVTKQIEKTKTQQTSKAETKTDNKTEENNDSQTSNNTNNNDNSTNQQNSAIIDKYKSLIIQAIAQEWIVPDDLDKNLVCKLLINVGPGGVVLRVQITQPSGNPLLDRSAQNAVLKASPLPVPKETSLLDNFRTIQLTVKPNEIT